MPFAVAVGRWQQMAAYTARSSPARHNSEHQWRSYHFISVTYSSIFSIRMRLIILSSPLTTLDNHLANNDQTAAATKCVAKDA